MFCPWSRWVRVVAVALQVLADEVRVVAVGDEAYALGEERIFRRDLFQADRPGLACDLGETGGSSTSSRTPMLRSVNA